MSSRVGLYFWYFLGALFGLACVLLMVGGLEHVLSGNTSRAVLNLLVAGASGFSAYNSVRRARQRGAS
jgi:hypothetical protein